MKRKKRFLPKQSLFGESPKEIERAAEEAAERRAKEKKLLRLERRRRKRRERRAMTIRRFCFQYDISRSFFYKLRRQGLAPRLMKIGSLLRITTKEARRWRREMERAYEDKMKAKAKAKARAQERTLEKRNQAEPDLEID